MWNPLETIIKKKMAKRYAVGSEPLSLVLYYERNDPIWDVLRPLVEERRAEILTCFDAGNFDHLWLFLANEKRIPFSFEDAMPRVIPLHDFRVYAFRWQSRMIRKLLISADRDFVPAVNCNQPIARCNFLCSARPDWDRPRSVGVTQGGASGAPEPRANSIPNVYGVAIRGTSISTSELTKWKANDRCPFTNL